jgi:hypothetical protein
MVVNHQKRGIIWVNNYTKAGLMSLLNSGMCADGFYRNLLPQPDPTQEFRHGDAELLQAYDTAIQQLRVLDDPHDFFDPVEVTSGLDLDYAELVDILYFCGHGSTTELKFGTTLSSAPASDYGANYADIQLGNAPKAKIKWLVADACQVLNEIGVFNRWPQAFAPGGTMRAILGYHSDCMNDNYRGLFFAQELNGQNLIKDAWATACLYTDTTARTGEWAILFIGDANGAIMHDRWTDLNLMDLPAPDANGMQTFTYLRRTFTPIATPVVISDLG